jgi:hypothetical protein
MWISFETKEEKKDSPKIQKRFIIRPFLGGVNGISGESMIGDMSSLLRKMNSVSAEQDYLVLPEQKWLDGIAISPGRVKQFVATPILSALQQSVRASATAFEQDSPKSRINKGRLPVGASVEYQSTGRDTVGGLQLHIISEHDTTWMSFSNCPDVCFEGEYARSFNYERPTLLGAKQLDVFKTPLELGLQPGDTIHFKDMRVLKPDRPKTLQDLLEEGEGLPMDEPSLTLEATNSLARKIDATISFDGSSSAPLSVEVSDLFQLAFSRHGISSLT